MASLATSALFIWRGLNRDSNRAFRDARNSLDSSAGDGAEGAQRGVEPDGALPPGIVDVETELRASIAANQAAATQASVTLRFALQSDLQLRINRASLRQLVGDAITQAIDATPGGEVLLTCARYASGILISISDDGVPTDKAIRASRLRHVAEACALLGGSVDIESLAEGVTVILRLPMPMPGATAPDPHTADEHNPPASAPLRMVS
jgi:hypothetical protein